jgi:hypothetical protein
LIKMVEVAGMLTCESCGSDRFTIHATGGPFVAKCVGLVHPGPFTTEHCGAKRVLTASATDDTRREDEPGDWVIAGFEGECSRGGGIFVGNATIRADGDGGWECREHAEQKALGGSRDCLE